MPANHYRGARADASAREAREVCSVTVRGLVCTDVRSWLGRGGPVAVALACLCACPATPAPEADRAPPPAAAAKPEPKPGSGPAFIAAPAEGEVVDIVLAERERVEAEGGRLIVYVGATWCEPCAHFHEAVDSGALDEAFPRLRLLEFDLDRDQDRLVAAGYGSRMIPLFVAPAPDGRASPRRTEGAIKGPRAVEHIRPRLEAILAASANDPD
jgi:hypothetical protein